MAAGTHLKKITARAKKLRKARPGMKWTNAVKQASRELKGLSGVKKKKPPAAKKKRVTVVNISGTKRKRKKSTSMAKKKTKRRAPRRRGIGSLSVGGYKAILMQTGGAIAGGLVAASVGNLIATKINNPKAVAGIQLLGGIWLARSQAKHPLISGLGLGLAAYGGGALLRSSGVLKGLGADDDYMSGDDDYISGDDEAGGLSAIDESPDGLGDDDDGMGDDDGF